MFMLLFLFALFRNLQGATLAPGDSGDVTDILPTAHVLPDVVFASRSTAGIVISCLATIFACTFTAIHPNIPSPADSRWNNFKRRFVTTIYALLAPELITIWAFRQYIGARRIAQEYNTAMGKQVGKERFSEKTCFRELWDAAKWVCHPHSYRSIAEVQDQRGSQNSYPKTLWLGAKIFSAAVINWLFESPPFHRAKPGKIEPWTTTHGFFVQMGGFMLCKDGRPSQTLDFSRLRREIHERNIEAPRITRAEINDRSKGNIISKTLVVLQTTWFITQCIARWSAMLPVTELEIVTLAFSMLNGITYALWWDKPQNVEVPVYIDIKAPLTDSLDDDLVASSGLMEALAYNRVSLTDPLDTRSSVSHTEALTIESQITMGSTRSGEDWESLASEGLIDAKLCKQGFFSRQREQVRKDYDGFQYLLRISYLAIASVIRSAGKLFNANLTDSVDSRDLRVGMFYADDDIELDSGILPINITIGLGTALFGCVHLVPSLFLHYSSPVKMWLWWVSAAFITIQPPLTTALITYQIFKNDTSGRHDDPYWAKSLIIQAPMCLYPLFRLALITLAFISLRDLPPNSHLAIDWISSIPHL